MMQEDQCERLAAVQFSPISANFRHAKKSDYAMYGPPYLCLWSNEVQSHYDFRKINWNTSNGLDYHFSSPDQNSIKIFFKTTCNSVPQQYKWQKIYHYLPKIPIKQRPNDMMLNWHLCKNADLNAYEHCAFIDVFEITKSPPKILQFISSM